MFQTTSPVDKSVICDVAHGTAVDIDVAANAASEAFAAWRDTPATERKKILIRVAEGIEARAEEIALCECWDTGQACSSCPRPRCAGPRISGTSPIRCSGARRAAPEVADIDERHDARADWPGRGHHPVEHALHAVHVEDRARARRGLHRRTQTGRSLPADGALLVEIAEEAGLPPGV